MSSVVLVGRTQPIPERVAALHLGDMCALPCWIGITPGKTTVAEAWQIIANVYNQGKPLAFDPLHGSVNLKLFNGLSLSISLGGWAEGLPNDSKLLVYGFELAELDGGLRLGDVMGSFGRPYGVDLIWGCCSGMAVYTPFANIQVQSRPMLNAADPQYFFLTMPVDAIFLAIQNNSNRTLWHGAGTYWPVFPDFSHG